MGSLKLPFFSAFQRNLLHMLAVHHLGCHFAGSEFSRIKKLNGKFLIGSSLMRDLPVLSQTTKIDCSEEEVQGVFKRKKSISN